MSIYEKSAGELLRDFVKERGIKKGEIIEKQIVESWFKEKYPLIKPATINNYFRKLSTNVESRISWNPNKKDDFLYQLDGKRFRLYDSLSDPKPIYAKLKESEKESEIMIETTDEDGIGENEFAYEKDLQNFLAKNLNLIEKGLTLYKEKEISGIEFPVGNRAIDILALDKNKNYVVIELKVSRGYDRVVGQILRYIAWIRKNHADMSQKVRGIIIAREITEDLVLACSETPNVELFEYSLSVSLKKIEKPND